jgi:hypothetical protein
MSVTIRFLSGTSMPLTESPHSLSYLWSHPKIYYPTPHTQISITPVLKALSSQTYLTVSWFIIKTVQSDIHFALIQIKPQILLGLHFNFHLPPSTFLNWKILAYIFRYQSSLNHAHQNCSHPGHTHLILPLDTSTQASAFLKQATSSIPHCWPPPTMLSAQASLQSRGTLPRSQFLPVPTYPAFCLLCSFRPIPPLPDPFTPTHNVIPFSPLNASSPSSEKPPPGFPLQKLLSHHSTPPTRVPMLPSPQTRHPSSHQICRRHQTQSPPLL